MIDNVVEATRDVNISGDSSKTVTFTTAKDAVGTYTVEIEGQSGSFTVREEAEAPSPARPINWWLIGVILAGVLAISVIAWLVFVQRRLEERTL